MKERLVEAAARALLASESNGELHWNALDLITRGAFKRDATAAVAAILKELEEPTPEMVEAGERLQHRAPFSGTVTESADADDIFRAMLGAVGE